LGQNDRMAKMLLGDAATIHVGAEVISRQYPKSTDYYDGNWVQSVVSVDSGSLRGTFECWLCTYDFPSFRLGIERLYESLEGEASFSTTEDVLTIHVRGDGIGHIEADVTAVDRSLGTFATLAFTMRVDQTYLPSLIEQLSAIEQAFPVVGSR
jgi:hypothetical protein